MVRISDNHRFTTTVGRMNQARELFDNKHEIIMSGRKVRRLSDSPVSSLRLFRNRSKLSNIGQFKRSLDYVKGFMEKTEDALRSINDSLIRVKELAIQQSNATWDPLTRKTVAQEVLQIKDHITTLGNSTYADRYVFGGFRNDSPPIAPNGRFLGDDGVMYIQLDEDSFRPINISGRPIFDRPPDLEKESLGVVEVVDKVYQSLMENDLDRLHSGMSQLDSISERVVDSIARIGARRMAVDDVEERIDSTEKRLYEDSNNLESAEPMEAALDFKRAETALQQTLEASSRAMVPTLINFLK